jgi:molybdopterin-guanine dinucleotide biosynthesis protein A
VSGGVLGAILAGGEARRMGGGDKCLLRVGKQTILERLRAALAPQVASQVLIANGPPQRFGDCGLPVLADDAGLPGGPVAGIATALRHGRDAGFDAVFVMPGDTPVIPANLVALLAAAQKPVARVVLAGQPFPVISLWSTRTAEEVLRLAGADEAAPWRIQAALGAADVAVQACPPELADIDTPDDLAAVEAMLQGT